VPVFNCHFPLSAPYTYQEQLMHALKDVSEATKAAMLGVMANLSGELKVIGLQV
jgi:hypothetical protein